MAKGHLIPYPGTPEEWRRYHQWITKWNESRDVEMLRVLIGQFATRDGDCPTFEVTPSSSREQNTHRLQDIANGRNGFACFILMATKCDDDSEEEAGAKVKKPETAANLKAIDDLFCKIHSTPQSSSSWLYGLITWTGKEDPFQERSSGMRCNGYLREFFETYIYSPENGETRRLFCMFLPFSKIMGDESLRFIQMEEIERTCKKILSQASWDDLLWSKSQLVPYNFKEEIRRIVFEPLHFAVDSNSPDLVRKLAKAGARIDEAKAGWTPLCRAVERGYPEVVKELLTQGASANVKNSAGLTPLHLALENDLMIANMLIEHGAPNTGFTLFSYACMHGDVDTALYFLEGAKGLLNVGNPHPLWLSVDQEQVKVLEQVFAPHKTHLLLERATAPDGTTPLMMAALKSSKPLVDTLLRLFYSQEDVLETLTEFGRAFLLKELVTSNVEVDGAELPTLAIQSGSAETVSIILFKTKEAKLPLVKSHDTAILRLLNMPCSPLKSGLVEMSRTFPKFNSAVEKNMTIDGGQLTWDIKELSRLVLKSPCALLDATELLHVGDLEVKKCSATCQQQTECSKIASLLHACKLLSDDLSTSSRLSVLGPQLVLAGSVAEGTCIAGMGSIDVTVEFKQLKRRPLILSDGDATKLLVLSDDHPLKNMKDVAVDGLFNYSTFSTLFLEELRTCLKKRKNDLNGLSLWANIDWAPCQKCSRLTETMSSSVYSARTHCEKCLPAVTHTKLGPCLLFSYRATKYDEAVLKVNLIPVFPLKLDLYNDHAGSLFDSVTRTLLTKKPENWLRHLEEVVMRDRPLPESFTTSVLEDDITCVQEVAIKLLNYGPEDNCIIRPGHNLQMSGFDSNSGLRTVYAYLKAIKTCLNVDISSYFVKKVLLGHTDLLEYISETRFNLEKSLLIALQHPELSSHFGHRINFLKWESKVKEYESDGGPMPSDGKIPLHKNPSTTAQTSSELSELEYSKLLK